MATGLAVNEKGTSPSPFMDALTAKGTTNTQTSVKGATSRKRKFIDRRHQSFVKRLRFSVRQIESVYRYRDIVVRKQDGFTHVVLSRKSSENNSLNLEVMKEVQSALNTAAADDSKLVLLSVIGSVFCCGLDFISYGVSQMTGKEKALKWLRLSEISQSPDGCSTVTFPKIMGEPSANEMFLSGQKLTAQEACSKGLVSQVFWPGTFTQEVMIRVRELALCNPVVLEESKALMRCNMKLELELEQANKREYEVLKKIWGSAQGVDSMLKYLQRKIDEF
ncbi:Chromodomain Y-like protein [Heterocephalus glaber]|uniref:Chromodomain Y-like protein n=1 Tax=Heterocephalus glaber TaxID=10181 RepID=G5BJH6_HETGA|nr:Chromodomain Y-like protein [Heterocephalus glaber]